MEKGLYRILENARPGDRFYTRSGELVIILTTADFEDRYTKLMARKVYLTKQDREMFYYDDGTWNIQTIEHKDDIIRREDLGDLVKHVEEIAIEVEKYGLQNT